MVDHPKMGPWSDRAVEQCRLQHDHETAKTCPYRSGSPRADPHLNVAACRTASYQRNMILLLTC